VGPYRDDTFPSWSEEDLWLRLDEVLELALKWPQHAYALAWHLWLDSNGFPDVRNAASVLMSELVVPFGDPE
jgi:hypothetical protein